MEPNVQKPKTTAKAFFVNLGAFITLYTLIATLLTFIFSVINTMFPDIQRSYNYYDPYGSSLRMSISILIVATPLLIYLFRVIHKMIQADPTQKDIGIRKFGLYLTLFLSVIMIATDIIVFINNFLGGETATRFIWKVVATLLVGIALVFYTKLDLKNYFSDNRKAGTGTAWAFCIVILGAVVLGISIIGMPQDMRSIRADQQRESDLYTLNSRIINYYQSKNGTLPATLADMNVGDPYASTIPTDPETMAPYIYKVVKQGQKYVAGEIVPSNAFPEYELCATFGLDGNADERLQSGGSRITSPAYDSMYYGGGYEGMFNNHPAGNHCFKLSIDPQRYPPHNPIKPLY